MQLLCDEGVDRQIVERLRADGHVVSYVAEQNPGVADAPILEQARSGQVLLVTADKGLRRPRRFVTSTLLPGSCYCAWPVCRLERKQTSQPLRSRAVPTR